MQADVCVHGQEPGENQGTGGAEEGGKGQRTKAGDNMGGRGEGRGRCSWGRDAGRQGQDLLF